MSGRQPVYLRIDQWSLVDDLLIAAGGIIAAEAEAGQSLMVQLRPPSRVALRWSKKRIDEIRAEIATRLAEDTAR